MMRQWLPKLALVLASLLGLAGPAAARQLQRVYLAPQTIKVEPGKPAILRGACLDEEIRGAPGTDDRITRFSDPRAIVIRELEDGRPTGREQNLQDVLDGTTKNPWVEFYGASDISDGVNLMV